MRKLFLLCVMLITFSSCNTNPPEDIGDSFAVAKAYVKLNLNYPEEANFKLSGVEHEYLGNNECIVKGTVIAKNAFWVKSKLKYRVKLRYKEGRGIDPRNWDVLECSVY